MTNQICVIILTKNEAMHLERCVKSLIDLKADVVICDSGSTDKTCEIAKKYSLKIITNVWVNYSRQFNWALNELRDDYEWVLRIDADEIASKELVLSINKVVSENDSAISGYLIKRSMTFISDKVKSGGIFPVHMLRLFRAQKGHCEERWMDEHIIVSGMTDVIDNGMIIDDSKKTLTFWVEKHNNYASREAVDHFVTKLGLTEEITNSSSGSENARKRNLKDKVYRRLPLRLRAFVYFIYRYVLRGGFRDRKFGHDFHLMQGLWYRYLVDMKIVEVQKFAKEHNCDLGKAIFECLQIDIESYYGRKFPK
jgi:glycosyltransferase involved in cell wall biosynthesis